MSDDLISRQAALRELHLLAIEALRKQRHDYNALITICSNKLRDLPAIQPEQKTGRWILDTTQFLPEYFCTNCKSRFPLVASEGKFYSTLCCKNMNYCPNCGEKMESEEKHGTDD